MQLYKQFCYFFLPGVGYGMLIISAYVGIYYNVIIMYTLYYMFASFTAVLPWIGCGQTWNSEKCSNIVADCLAAGGIVTDDNKYEKSIWELFFNFLDNFVHNILINIFWIKPILVIQ